MIETGGTKEQPGVQFSQMMQEKTESGMGFDLWNLLRLPLQFVYTRLLEIKKMSN